MVDRCDFGRASIASLLRRVYYELNTRSVVIGWLGQTSILYDVWEQVSLRFPDGRQKAQRPTPSSIAGRLVLARLEARLTRSRLASLAEVQNGELRAWENGESIPSYEQLEKLARFFSVSPGWLSSGDVIPDNSDIGQNVRAGMVGKHLPTRAARLQRWLTRRQSIRSCPEWERIRALASLAERLRALRRVAELTQADVIWALGLSTGTLTRFEAFNEVPSVEQLTQLAEFFGVTNEFLLCGDRP